MGIMSRATTAGLTKEQVRRIVLSKLKVVNRDWNLAGPPFADRDIRPGTRRRNGRAFETALIAALLGGVSEAIEKNNQALAADLAPGLPVRATRSDPH